MQYWEPGWRSRVGELCRLVFGKALPDHAHVGHRPNFDNGAVFEARTHPRDFQGFVLVCDLQVKIAADGFLRLGEWTVGYSSPLLARNEFALAFQRMAARASSFL